MLTRKGTVLDVREGTARIEIIHKGGSCCSSCGFGCGIKGKEGITQVPAPEGLQPGDTVTLQMPARSAALAATLLFVIPLILLIGGTLLGGRFFPTDAEGQINLAALGLGAGLMFLWYVGVALTERASGKITPAAPTITHIEHRQA